MTKFVLLCFVIFASRVSPGATIALSCDVLMASMAKSGDSTSLYVALVKKLALEKGAFPQGTLDKLLRQTETPNPLEFVSNSLSSALRYAYTRAFESLHEVDWARAQNELKGAARGIAENDKLKDEASHVTSSIYAPVEVESIISTEKMEWRGSRAFFKPRDRAPLLTVNRDGKTYSVDLETQTMRLLGQSGKIEFQTFKQLRTGRIILMYFIAGDYKGRVEDALTGELLSTFNPRADFPNYGTRALPGGLNLYETKSGGIKVLIESVGSRRRFVYDFAKNKKYVIEGPVIRTEDVVFCAEDVGGELYAFVKHRIGLNDQFSLLHLEEHGSHTLIDHGLVPYEGLSLDNIYDFKTDNGEVGFFGSGSGGFVILRPESKQFHRVAYNNEKLLAAEVVEWPRGSLNGLIRTGHEFYEDITLIDQSGQKNSISVPAAPSELSELVELDLQNGNRLFVVARGFSTKLTGVSFLDFYAGTVKTIQLPAGLQAMGKVYEGSDGRIFGIFADDKSQMKVLQLFGPLPDREAAP